MTALNSKNSSQLSILGNNRVIRPIGQRLSPIMTMTPDEEANLDAVMSTAHHDFQRGLNIHAYFRVSSHEMGEDLVQDTFMKTWRYLLKGGKVDTMKSFLYHVLNNLIVDQYRKHKTLSLDVMLEQGLEPTDGDHARLFDVLDGKAALVLIQRLPEAYQKVMRMRYIQDLSLKEISLITGQRVNTIAVQTHRGLKKLKLLHTQK